MTTEPTTDNDAVGDESEPAPAGGAIIDATATAASLGAITESPKRSEGEIEPLDAVVDADDNVGDETDDGDEAYGIDDINFDDFEMPSNMATMPSVPRRRAVSGAFLAAGLALEQVIYGRERSTVAAEVQEAAEPDPDADLVLHLDPEDPTKSRATLRGDR